MSWDLSIPSRLVSYSKPKPSYPRWSSGSRLIEKAYKRIIKKMKRPKEKPFEYHFVDQEYAKEFDNEERLGKLATVFAWLAIFITPMFEVFDFERLCL